MIRFIANTFITHFSKPITPLNQLLITKHIGEELIFSSTQTTPIWYSLYFQEWNNLSSQIGKIWFIQSSELNDYLWKSQRNQATPNPISLLIQIILFLPSFHCHTIHSMRCDHSLLPVESPKSKQTTNHLHPIQQFLFHHANQHPLHWINSQCVAGFLHLDG